MNLPLEPRPSEGFANRSRYEDGAVPDETGDIMAFLIERFHNVHRDEFPRLIALARDSIKVSVSRSAGVRYRRSGCLPEAGPGATAAAGSRSASAR